jgi:hypothetical protein
MYIGQCLVVFCSYLLGAEGTFFWMVKDESVVTYPFTLLRSECM